MPITSRAGGRDLAPELAGHLDAWVGRQPLTHDLAQACDGTAYADVVASYVAGGLREVALTPTLIGP